MPGRIVISNPQNLVKDCYASAPKIDLTVRANGEESVMVMNALGQWVVAGFNSPSVSAGISAALPTGSFTANMYWAYQYVYVAKIAYPLVENAQTGGGSVAPRTNPSPKTTTDSVTNIDQKTLSIPTTQRSDLSHIWIYRTAYFSTAQQASDFADAGNLFWIGEVANNPNLASVNFIDNGSVAGLEQIENDNFTAPIFDKVVFADPYFWGFGNSVFSASVSVDTTGLIAITDSNKWFDGRNAQTITFDGITSGGYNAQGSFYFKQIDNFTAQLYDDIALTQTVGLDVNGTTTCYIRGESTTLYRSKPRNPFSWGSTDLIGDVQVPSPYAFGVGGGNGTALAVIASLNLLKLDTELPNRTYTLNLKNAGTPNFEPSLRIISDVFSVSNQHSQFSAILQQGQNVLWGMDSKSFSIIQCDGASQNVISDEVYNTMRNLSDVYEDRLLSHGIYCPRLEMNCMFFKTFGVTGQAVNKMVYYHAPTGYWGILDCMDVLCSSSIVDPAVGQQKIIVGTETGYVGEMFAEGQYQNWFQPAWLGTPSAGTQAHGLITPVSSTSTTIVSDINFRNIHGDVVPCVEGNWLTVLVPRNIPTIAVTTDKYYCRIATVANDGITLNLDRVYKAANDINGEIFLTTFPVLNFGGFPFNTGTIAYIGLIEMQIGRSFNGHGIAEKELSRNFLGQIPFNYRNLEEIWSAWKYTVNILSIPTDSGPVNAIAGDIYPPTIEMYNGYLDENPYGKNQRQLTLAPDGSDVLLTSQTKYWAQQTSLNLDQTKIFGMVFRDQGFNESHFMAYEARLSLSV